MPTKLTAAWMLIPLCFVLLTACGPAEEPPPPPDIEDDIDIPDIEPAPEPDPEDTVSLYRDRWGVPHIFADSDEAAMFALGYAQAEDRLPDIFENIRVAVGRHAEVAGASAVENDLTMLMVRNAEASETHWNEAVSNDVRVLAEHFILGIEAYMDEYPERIPEHAFDLEPWHTLAVGRAMILRWPIGTMRSKLGRREDPPGPEMASNQWAVAPERSAHGGAILLTDPHLTWENLAIFHEARIRGDQLALNGHFVVGSMLVGLGHNDYVGWASTTGGPNTSDVYVLRLNPDNPMEYELDGEWRTLEERTVEIAVAGQDEPSSHTIYESYWGPLLEDPDTEHNVAYAGATPYMDATELLEQAYAMGTATNADEFYEAIKMNQFMEQNFMFADREGNIGYVRVGRTPIRPEGFDWHRPVPGHTTETEWQGVHPIEDHVQIMNPEHGYMQNNNISPENMMVDSPLLPENYPDYIYNVSWDTDNPRSRRAVQVLDADDNMTKEAAMALTTDVYCLLAEPWQNALRDAVEAAGDDYMADDTFAGVVDTLLGWNGEYTRDSVGTPILKHWRLKCEDHGGVDLAAIAEDEPLDPDDQAVLLELLAESIDELEELHGTLDLTWGDTHFIERNGESFSTGAGKYGQGLDGVNRTNTLLDVGYREDPESPGRYVGYQGSFAISLMFFHEDEIESYTLVSWGQSSDPDSPHFIDQGRELFANRELKRTAFSMEELEGRIESEKVLTLP